LAIITRPQPIRHTLNLKAAKSGILVGVFAVRWDQKRKEK
jgi:hypothetical protein